MRWAVSYRASPRGKRIADRHYNRQNPEATQFVPPGACLVLVTVEGDALWVTSAPLAEFVGHAWAGAWVNSTFRNEGKHLSSELIREAVAATKARWPVPELGMVTFVDATQVRRKRDPGVCYHHAGFVRSMRCGACGADAPVGTPRPARHERVECPACEEPKVGRTVTDDLLVFHLPPELMPPAAPALEAQGSLW